MTAEKHTDSTGTVTYKTIFVKPLFEVAADGTVDFYRVIDEKKQHFKTNLKSISADTIFYGIPIIGFGHNMDFQSMKRVVPVAITVKMKTSPSKVAIKMMAPHHLLGSSPGGGRGASVVDV